MNKYIILFCCFASSLSAKIDISEYKLFLRAWEGYNNRPYLERSGVLIIGIGHNLNANKTGLKSYYSDQEIHQLFLRDLSLALDTARTFVRDFDQLPEDAKLVTVSLIFTVGRKGFIKFYKYRDALSNKNYQEAAEELHNSKWRHQVFGRAKHHIRLLKMLKN